MFKKPAFQLCFMNVAVAKENKKNHFYGLAIGRLIVKKNHFYGLAIGHVIVARA